MKIFLAGGNDKKKIISFLEVKMRVFIAGGMTGNLNPAYHKFAKTKLTDDDFIKVLKNENFWQGGSQDTGYKM